MAEKRKYVKLITPKGAASFPCLAKPDLKYNADKGGEYKIDIVVDPKAPGMAEMAKTIKAMAKESCAKANKEQESKPVKKRINFTEQYPIVKDTDKEGNETGLLRIRCKRVATYKNAKGEVIPSRVDVVDSKNQPVAKVNKLGQGSLVRASVTVIPYAIEGTEKAGVRLSLDAVQVLEFKEWVRSHGFGTEEGGYVASEEDVEGGGGGSFEQEHSDSPAESGGDKSGGSAGGSADF